jgi:hypothetical protein
MAGWIDRVNSDPLPWLLDESTAAVRHLALRGLLDRAADNPEVVAARAAAMRADPIASILAAQNPEGWWAKPGPGYSPKYTSTVWQLIFLDQLGADDRPGKPSKWVTLRACRVLKAVAESGEVVVARASPTP